MDCPENLDWMAMLYTWIRPQYVFRTARAAALVAQYTSSDWVGTEVADCHQQEEKLASSEISMVALQNGWVEAHRLLLSSTVDIQELVDQSFLQPD